MSLKCVQKILVVLGVVDMCELLLNAPSFSFSRSYFGYFKLSDQNFVRKADGNRILQEFRVEPNLNTQSCNRRPLCSTFTFENVCNPKKSFIPKKKEKKEDLLCNFLVQSL